MPEPMRMSYWLGWLVPERHDLAVTYLHYYRVNVFALLSWAFLTLLLASPSGVAGAQSLAGIEDFQDLKPLRAALVLTADPDHLRDSLARGEEKIQIVPTERAKRGAPIALVVVFGDCPTDERYHCMLKADFVVIAPDGGTHGQMLGQDIWYDLPTPPEGAMQVGRAGAQLQLGDDDLLGTYSVRATVNDEITGEQLTLQSKIEFVADEPAPETPKGE